MSSGMNLNRESKMNRMNPDTFRSTERIMGVFCAAESIRNGFSSDTSGLLLRLRADGCTIDPGSLLFVFFVLCFDHNLRLCLHGVRALLSPSFQRAIRYENASTQKRMEGTITQKTRLFPAGSCVDAGTEPGEPNPQSPRTGTDSR